MYGPATLWISGVDALSPGLHQHPDGVELPDETRHVERRQSLEDGDAWRSTTCNSQNCLLLKFSYSTTFNESNWPGAGGNATVNI